MSLDMPIVKVQVVRFIEVLTVFAWGAKVAFRAGDVTFTTNCSVHLGDLNLLSREADAAVAAYFAPGRTFDVELGLSDAASDHNVTVLDPSTPSSIRELAQLDWEIHGITTSAVEEEEVLIDCGVPMLAFWSGEPMPRGTHARWTGEIRAYIVD